MLCHVCSPLNWMIRVLCTAWELSVLCSVYSPLNWMFCVLCTTWELNVLCSVYSPLNWMFFVFCAQSGNWVFCVLICFWVKSNVGTTHVDRAVRLRKTLFISRGITLYFLILWSLIMAVVLQTTDDTFKQNLLQIKHLLHPHWHCLRHSRNMSRSRDYTQCIIFESDSLWTFIKMFYYWIMGELHT